MLIGTINPQILKELDKPSLDDIIAKAPLQASSNKKADEDERVMKSITKFTALKQKWEKEENIYLDPDKDPDKEE